MYNTIIRHGLWASWLKDTAHESVRDKWHEGNKAIGQCAITALLIRDILGGEIIKADVCNCGFSHYRNKVKGEEIDFTYDQFDKEPLFKNKALASVEKLLSNADTNIRYSLLKKSFNNFIKNYEDIEKIVSNCRLCNRVDNFNHNSIHFGNNCTLLLIGEAPAKNGWQITGKAWINQDGNIVPSGRILQKLLDILGINLFDVTFTEAIKCLPKDRKYIKVAMNNCSHILYKQIELLQPNIIISLGENPTRAFLPGFKKFVDVVGKEHIIHINNKEFALIPIYHPSPISPKSFVGNIPIFKLLKEKNR